MDNHPNNPFPERKIAVPKRRLNRTASTVSLGSVGSASSVGNPSGFGFPVAPPQQQGFGSGFGSNLAQSNMAQPMEFNTENNAPMTFGSNNDGNFNKQLFGGSFSSPFGGSNSGNTNQPASFGFSNTAPATNSPFNTSNPNPSPSPFAGFSFGTPSVSAAASNPPTFGSMTTETATQPTAFNFGQTQNGPMNQTPSFSFGQQQNAPNPFASFGSSQSITADSSDSRKRRLSVDMEDADEPEEQSNKKSFVFGSSGSSGSVAPAFSFGSFAAKTNLDDPEKADTEIPFSVPAANATTVSETSTSVATSNFSLSTSSTKANNEAFSTSTSSPFSFGSISTTNSQKENNQLTTTSKPFDFQDRLSSAAPSSSENIRKDSPFSFATTPLTTAGGSLKATPTFTFGSVLSKDSTTESQKANALVESKNANESNIAQTDNSVEKNSIGVDENSEVRKAIESKDVESSLAEDKSASKTSNLSDSNKPLLFSNDKDDKLENQKNPSIPGTPETTLSLVPSQGTMLSSLSSENATNKVVVEEVPEDKSVASAPDSPEVSEPEESSPGSDVLNASDSPKNVTVNLEASDKENADSKKADPTHSVTSPSSNLKEEDTGSKEKSSAPAFSFEKPLSSSSAATAFSFGKAVSTPLTSSATPAFSFGKTTQTSASTPNVSSENSSSAPASKPVFSFGQPASTPPSTTTTSSEQQASTSTATPVFSFGEGANTSTPNSTFSFGKVTSTPISAPTSSSENTPAISSTKPTFSFSPPTSAPSSDPAVSSGQSTNVPTATPISSFGKPTSSPISTPATVSENTSAVPPSSFEFGTGKSDISSSGPTSATLDTASSTAATSAPTFSFGSASSAPSSTPITTSSVGNVSSSTVVSPTPAFSFGSMSSATASSAGSVSNAAVASSTPIFSSESASSAPSATSAVPSTTENTNSSAATSSTPAFSLGGVSSASPSASTTPSSAPTFSFGSTSSAPLSTSKSPLSNPTFSFGASSNTLASEKKDSKNPEVKTTEPKPQEKTSSTFTFGTAPVSNLPKSQNTDKEATGLDTNKSQTATTNSASATQSTTANPVTKENTTLATIPTTPAVTESNNKQPEAKEPIIQGSTTIAFSNSDTATKDDSNTLSLKPIPRRVSRDSPYVPSTLTTTVSTPQEVTYATRFWELPEGARGELAELQHLISQQAEKRHRIQGQLNTAFVTQLNDIRTNTENLSVDADIINRKLHMQRESIYKVMDHNAQHRNNIAATSSVLKADNKNWRALGASENWQFFMNAISSIEERTHQYTAAVQSIEETIDSLSHESDFTPEVLTSIMNGQKRMFMSMAGKVAGLHEEVERIVKKRKL